MAQEQLVTKSVFPPLKPGQKASDPAVQPIRTGLVPKDLEPGKNGSNWMAYWTEQDRKNAEREAKDAARAAEAAAAPAEKDAGEVVGALEDRLAAVEAQMEGVEQLRQATPEEVNRGVALLHRARGMAAAVESAGMVVISKVEAAQRGAEALLQRIEGQVGQAAEALGQLLSDIEQRFTANEAARDAKLAKAISKRVAGLEVQVSQMRGPRGAKGEWGSGQVHGKGKPPAKHPSGREWAVGEGYIDYSKENLPLYVRLADSWDKPVATRMGDKLINAQVNTLDMAPRISTSQTIAQTGGGAGGGGERLLANAASRSTSVTIGDSSNWAPTNQDPTSGMLLLEVTAVDGTLAGRRGYASVSFTYDAAGSNVTEFALLGDLADVYRFDITVSRSGAVLPAGLTGVSIPPGKSRTKVDLRIDPNNPASTGGVNSFLLSGVLLWTLKGSGRPLGAGQPGAEVPGWSWQ